MYKKFGKRVFDIIASAIGLVLLSPLFIIVAIVIKLTSKGPIFFVQKRVGQGFREFNLYKFRSMREGKGLLVTSKDDPRITKIGKIIRKTKIDELPQLLNVLKGDMSLVGPRPEVMKYVKAKENDYKEILKVKPGITDFAAIRYRNEEEELVKYDDKEKAYIEKVMPKKIAFYKEYIQKMSFLTDIEIILETLKIRFLNFDIFLPGNKKRTFMYIFSDIIFTYIAIYIAFLLRFDFDIPRQYIDDIYKAWGVLFGIRFILFYISGLYQASWRFFSFQDAIKLTYLLFTSTIIFTLIVYSQWDNIFIGFPRSAIAIEFFIALGLFLLFRMSKRVYLELFNKQALKEPILVVASPEKANEITRVLLKNSDYYPIAILNDEFKGIKINGINVLDFDKVKRSYNGIKSAIVSSEYDYNVVFEKLKELNIIKLKKFIDFDSNEQKTIEDITVRDLLARHPKDLDKKAIANFIKNKTILITGAGGSIGSELVRQCIKFSAKKLILLDHSEYNLYKIEQECEGKIDFECVMQSIVNKDLLEKTFKEYRPQIVLHAAAYKHVPLCEENIEEAILNNIIGTKNVIDLSIENNVEKFVLISTDKAVRPTNVMGATKRVCELYAQNVVSLENVESKDTEIVAVRFGNVLGSSGSVIPKFKEQIKNGGPITVTHPEITRYFMLIPEACALVLQAGAIGKGGEIFILDMGEPIKIVDLAKKMIELSGRDDIEIKFTGLRAGEKLYEELLIDEANAETKYQSIFIAKPTKYNIEKLNKDIVKLLTNNSKILQLKNIVPEFEHK